MITLDGNHLSIEDVVSTSRKYEKVSLSDVGRKNIETSHQRLVKIINSGKAVYGINTGFGLFADKMIKDHESKKLSRNLILSHAVGTGPLLEEEIVRAAMLIRANTLAKGFSGIRLEIVETIIEMLNRGVTPQIPSQGSLGSSGDLCQLSHMALVFTTDERDLDEESGIAQYEGVTLSGKEAMRKAGIKRVVLGPKEGLAINNGATFTAAISSLAIWDSDRLMDLFDISLAITAEALMCCSNAFDLRIHNARGLAGQKVIAQNFSKLIKGSTLIDATGRVQDAYSIRCAPQINGAVRDTYIHCRGVVESEINAATDNPLIFEDNSALSGGNFHGEPLAMVMDFLAIAMAEAGAVSERRIFRLVDDNLNYGLPAMLVDSPQAAGLNSGLMMPQYTAASLVLENRTLANPDSIQSLPTSGNQEDHNANAWTASRHARQIINNCQYINAIELFTACRALHLRLREKQNLHPGKTTKLIFDFIESKIGYHPDDKLWKNDIDMIYSIIRNDEFAFFIQD